MIASRPMRMKKVVVPYRTATGLAQREFTVYRSHHGPIVREVDGRWVAVRLMEEPLERGVALPHDAQAGELAPQLDEELLVPALRLGLGHHRAEHW